MANGNDICFGYLSCKTWLIIYRKGSSSCWKSSNFIALTCNFLFDYSICINLLLP